MKRRLVLFCATSLLIFPAHRLPAPIQEIPESPTPEQTPKPKIKPTPQSTKSHTAKQSPPPSTAAPAPSKKFGAKWSGIMPEVPWGYVQTELIVDPNERTMEWQESGKHKGSAKAQLNGNTLSALFPGWPRPVWSITPDPGGNTAQVRLQAFMNDDHAVFKRVSQ